MVKIHFHKGFAIKLSTGRTAQCNEWKIKTELIKITSDGKLTACISIDLADISTDKLNAFIKEAIAESNQD